MNSKKIYFLYIFAICTILSIILQAYLTNQYFQIHYGEGPSGSALCNLGQKFDCEAVTASPYSQFLGIPLSAWGLGLNITLFILLLGLMLSDAHKKLWVCTIQKFCFVSAIASVIMGAISLSMLNVYCLFCISLYLLSFAQFYLSLYLDPEEKGPMACLYSSLFSFNFKIKPFPLKIYICVLLFPLISIFIATKMKRNFGGPRAENLLKHSVKAWMEDKEVTEFKTPLALLSTHSSPKSPSFEIVEFADFLCGHCKRASKTIKSFMTTHKAQFKFYAFPLDQTCSSEDSKTTGPNCYLAKSTFCAQKQNKGWEFHDWIFEHQRELMTNFNETKAQIKKLSEQLELDTPSFLSCIEEENTHKVIVEQVQFARNLKITGTPTIFVNGKRLRKGSVLENLKRIYNITVDN